VVADLLTRGQDLQQLPSQIDPASEAMFLTAGAEGLQTRVLLGQLTPERALTLIDDQLDRVFTDPT
jgi:hypothetical protein